MEELNNQLDKLQLAQNELEKRLEPVLADWPTESDPDAFAETPRRLAVRLRECVGRVNSAINFNRRLMEQLEL